MPIHDWKRIDAGLFHHFHHGWTAMLVNALNAGVLPPDYFALSEQVAGGPMPDVLTLNRPEYSSTPPAARAGVALAVSAPQSRYIQQAPADPYAARANHIVIRHRFGQVVAMVEIVSPGNKSSRYALNTFVAKVSDCLNQRIHTLVVDLFPPTTRDPQGIHGAVWDKLGEEPFELPPDKPLTVVAYSAGTEFVAYVEPVAVGDLLPDMPLFLEPEFYVPTPLERTYQATWDACPTPLKDAVLGNLPPERR